jgi:phosphoribosylanthranilate isomerase
MTRVKICGLTNLADAEEAVRLGAWAVGLIHYPPSPRACPPDEAARIAAALKRRCEVVGVFVNATLDELDEVAENEALTMLQLHGDEGPAFCAEAARRTGCKIIKAARVKSSGDVRALEPFHTDFHLLDAHHEGLRGGTGQSFDWRLAGAHLGRAKVIVSGGLTPDNVAEAVATAQPFAVDVASGVEAEPGRKDHGRMAAFFDAVTISAPA